MMTRKIRRPVSIQKWSVLVQAEAAVILKPQA
jgi:hypothetical protein